MWVKIVWNGLVAATFLVLIPLYACLWWHGEPADWYIWLMAALGGLYWLLDAAEDVLDAIIKLKER